MFLPWLFWMYLSYYISLYSSLFTYLRNLNRNLSKYFKAQIYSKSTLQNNQKNILKVYLKGEKWLKIAMNLVYNYLFKGHFHLISPVANRKQSPSTPSNNYKEVQSALKFLILGTVGNNFALRDTFSSIYKFIKRSFNSFELIPIANFNSLSAIFV